MAEVSTSTPTTSPDASSRTTSTSCPVCVRKWKRRGWVALQADCFWSSVATNVSSRGPTRTGSAASRSAFRVASHVVQQVRVGVHRLYDAGVPEQRLHYLRVLAPLAIGHTRSLAIDQAGRVGRTDGDRWLEGSAISQTHALPAVVQRRELAQESPYEADTIVALRYTVARDAQRN